MISTFKQLSLSRRITTNGTVLTSFIPKTFEGARNFSGGLKKEDSSGYMYFPSFLTHRLQEASRSLVVRLPEPNAWQNFQDTCHLCGTISKMYMFENDSQNFVLVEMSDQNEVHEILKASRKDHNDTLFSYENEFGLYVTSQYEVKFEKGTHMVVQKSTLKAKSFKSVLKEVKNLKSVNDKIVQVYDAMKINEIGIRLKFLLCKQLQRVVHGIMSDATVYPFGSSVCGFGINGCDLDLAVVQNNIEREVIFNPLMNIERPIMQVQLEVISNILKFLLYGYSNVVYIKHARVPIVKFRHRYTGVDCDLSMYGGSGVQMSQLLYTLTQLDDRIRPLIFIVRLWAKRIGITQEQPHNTITNFSLTLLVIFFLQQSSTLRLPNFDAFPECNLFFSDDIVDSVLMSYNPGEEIKRKSVEDLLLLFFKFYSAFDFKAAGCCVKTGKAIEKNESFPLYIKNPLNPDLNVSRNVSPNNLSKFQEMASVAADYLDKSYTDDSHTIFTNLFHQPSYAHMLKQKVKSFDITKIFSQN